MLYSPVRNWNIQIIIEANTVNETARELYERLIPSANMALVESITVNGIAGVISPDKLTVYLVDENYIYILNKLSDPHHCTTMLLS